VQNLLGRGWHLGRPSRKPTHAPQRCGCLGWDRVGHGTVSKGRAVVQYGVTARAPVIVHGSTVRRQTGVNKIGVTGRGRGVGGHAPDAEVSGGGRGTRKPDLELGVRGNDGQLGHVCHNPRLRSEEAWSMHIRGRGRGRGRGMGRGQGKGSMRRGQGQGQGKER
jgi:hypothetical protein